MLTIEERHEKILYTCVRITTPKAKGSGTIIYSLPVPDGDSEDGPMYETYILTNEHVIDSLIEIKDDFDSFLKRNRRQDFLGIAEVDVFDYDYWSRATAGKTYRAQIVCYDKRQDMALLKLQDRGKFDYVASLCPPEKYNRLLVWQDVNTVGAGLGEDVFPSPPGWIAQFGKVIENEEYLMVSSASIFGNSGGGVFLMNTGEFIGIPSRIPVTWGGNTISHMNYIIPIWRINKFLEDQRFDFVLPWIDKTSTECAEERDRLRRIDNQFILREDLSSDGKTKKTAGKMW